MQVDLESATAFRDLAEGLAGSFGIGESYSSRPNPAYRAARVVGMFLCARVDWRPRQFIR